MKAPIVATVQSVTGNVITVDQDGEIRVLKSGDSLFAGETVKADANATATIIYINGSSQTIKSDTNLSLSDTDVIPILTTANADPLHAISSITQSSGVTAGNVTPTVNPVRDGNSSAYARPYLAPTSDVDSGHLTRGIGSTAGFNVAEQYATLTEAVVAAPLTRTAEEGYTLGISGSEVTVYESGLDQGSNPSASMRSAHGSFTVSNLNGSTASYTVQFNDGSVLSLGPSLINHSEEGKHGSLTVTSFNPNNGKVSYTYELTSPTVDLPGSETDVFSVKVSNSNSHKSVSAQVVANIVDDTPSVTVDNEAKGNGNLTTDDAGTRGGGHSTAQADFADTLSSAVHANHGADAGGSTTLSDYTLVVEDSDSGLKSHGQDISLHKTDNGEVKGSTASNAQDVSDDNTVFSVSVDNTGQVTVNQFAAIDHNGQGNGNGNGNDQDVTLNPGKLKLEAKVTVSDGDGDTVNSTVSTDVGKTMHFVDDTPSVTVDQINSDDITLVDHDANTTHGNSDSSSGNFSNDFSNAVHADYGADGAGSTTITDYTLVVEDSDSGLKSHGQDISLHQTDDGVVKGSTASNIQDVSDDNTVFSVSVDNTGQVTLNQFAAIDHNNGQGNGNDNGNGNDQDVSLNPGKLKLEAKTTVTDGDGSSASSTVSTDVGNSIHFTDDTPTITAGTVSDSNITLITQDADTVGAATDTASASFATAFLAAVNADYGADGPGSLVLNNYNLTINNAASGLSSAGSSIFLYNINGVVTGSTATTQGNVTADNTVFSVSVDHAGLVTLNQFSQIDHVGGGNGTQIALANGKITLSATATVTDYDGDAATATVGADLGSNIRFDDGVPTVTTSHIADCSIILATQDADTVGAATDIASASFASAFLAAANINYGGDNSGATAVVNNYALSISDAASGLSAGGLSILLYSINGVVTGSTATHRGQVSAANTIFSVAVDNAGQVTLTQFSALDHAGSAQLILANGKINLSATVTVTDGDGDTATASLSTDLGGNIRFDDDVPTVTVGTVAESSITLTTQDADTIGAATDTASASFATAFTAAVTANYGSDIPGTLTIGSYTLTVNTITSGLSSGGSSIFLYNIGGVVTGSTAATQVGVNSANTIFSISVDNSGLVTLNQFSQLDHGGAAQIALANGKITLSATATVADFDGNSATATVSADLGGNIRFDDDVPTVTVGTVAESSITLTTQDADTIGTATDIATASFASAFLAAVTPNYGADGAGSTTISNYSLAVNNAASGLASGGSSIYLYNIGGVVTGSTATTQGNVTADNTIFSIAVNNAGLVTLTQFSQLDHGGAAQLALANGKVTLSATATVTDFDGNSTTAAVNNVDLGGNIRFDDSAPIAPSLSLNASVILDETSGVQTAADPNASDDIASTSLPGSVSTAFNSLGIAWDFAASSSSAVTTVANYGADGAAANNAISYSLSVTNGTYSGVSTSSGTQIFLYNGSGSTSGLILGRVGTEGGATDTANANGVVAFAIAAGTDGKVYLAQYESIYNSIAGSTSAAYDDQITLTSNAVQMNVTLTDADGSTASSAINIGGQIGFQDDAPTLGSFNSAIIPNEVGTVTGLFNLTGSADGIASFNITGPTISGVSYTQSAQSNGSTVLLAQQSSTGTNIFSLTVNPDATYTFNLIAPQTASTSTVNLTTLTGGNSTFKETTDGLIEFSTTSGNSISSSTQGFGVNDQRVSNGEQFTMEFHSVANLGVDDAASSNPRFINSTALNYADINLGNQSTNNFITYTWTALNSSTNQTATGTITLTSSAAGSLVIDPGFTFNVLTVAGTDGITGSGKGARFQTADYTVQVVPSDQAYTFNVAAVDKDGDTSATQTLHIQQVVADSSGNFTLTGSTGDETIAGSTHTDTITGGGGNDIADYSGSTSAVSINLNDSGNASGAPSTFSNPADGTIGGGDATGDTLINLKGLIGSLGDDYLIGNSSSNYLSGGAGNDTIKGEGGNDTIVGGAGNDTLTGGTGADTFLWLAGDQGTTASPAVDTITDFSMAEGDVLNLSSLLSSVGTNAITLENLLQFTTSGSNTILNVSTTSGAAATQQIVLQNVSMSDLAGGAPSPTSTDVISHLLTTHQLVL